MRLELQADCFAGVWGHHADRSRNLLEPGDVEEALNAAAAIGDDRLQRQSAGARGARVLHPRHLRAARALVPAGLSSGDPNACDTFEAERL